VNDKQSLGKRNDVIAAIDAAGKRDEFITVWGRTPEEYFDEYAYKEPDIWQDVLDDLDLR